MASWVIFLIGAFFGLYETAYFGWNFTAHSSAEIICDGISALILSLAFVATAIEKRYQGKS